MQITIRAQASKNNHNGTFTLTLEGHPIDQGQQEVLDELFPHLQTQVKELLTKEALLASITRQFEDEGQSMPGEKY